MRYTFGAGRGERLAYLFASAVAHAVTVLAFSPSAPVRPDDDSGAATVVIETFDSEPPPETEPPRPQQDEPPPPERAADPPATAVDARPEPAPDVVPPTLDVASEPIAPGPMDLTDTVLTARGSGAAMQVAGAAVGARSKVGRAPAGRGGTAAPRAAALPPARVVPLEDLSRLPSPPALDGALARLYPPDARREGRGGSAVVRALVAADGRVRSASIAAATDASFGQACQELVMGSAWSPPLDEAGRPVATWVRYTCRFQIDR